MGSFGKLMTTAVLVGVMLQAGVYRVEAGTVLFDQGHGERFLPDWSDPLDLSRLADLFRQQGFAIKSVTEPLTDEVLADADALVVSGPFLPVTPGEVDVIAAFLARGGRLSIMLHIGGPAGDLLHRLGVDFSNGVMREQRDIIAGNPLNFLVTRLEHHPLFEGVPQFSLYGGWALMNTADNTAVIATTSPEAWVDLDGDGKLSAADAVQAFGVVVAGKQGHGRFVVFGDDAIFQNKFLEAGNRALAVNLVSWLGGVQRESAATEELLQELVGP